MIKRTFISLFGGLLLTALFSSCGGGGGGGAMQADLANGEAVYKKACIACHMTGVAGAAALSDKPRWEENAAKGLTALTQSAVTGYTGKYGMMPEKGTCMDCTEQDLYDAISYMMDQAGVKPVD